MIFRKTEAEYFSRRDLTLLLIRRSDLPVGQQLASRSPHERSDMRGYSPGCRFAHPGNASDIAREFARSGGFPPIRAP